MRSTFHGLETARRGMFTQQTALETTGHNIANANTPGYSRQRVNFVQTEPYPAPAMNRPQIPGQMGTGVKAGTIERVREKFLDLQYREENNELGYWAAKAEALAKMEEIMNEPSEEGLSKTLDRFWQSLQDLAANPHDAGARSVVRQRGLAVAETFNYLFDSLKAIQSDFQKQIDVTINQINSIARQINNINKQIGDIEPHGYLPNDLYDERDRLLDELSHLVKIDIDVVNSGTKVSQGGNTLDIAEGKFTVYLLDANGNRLNPPLVDASNYTTNTLSVTYGGANGAVSQFELTDPLGVVTPYSYNAFQVNGKLKGLVDSYGYDNGGVDNGVFPDMIRDLDAMAQALVQYFNQVHRQGFDLDGDTNNDFFTYAAGKMGLDPLITTSLNNISAGLTNSVGDGNNAFELGRVLKDSQVSVGGVPTNIMIAGNNTDISSFYEGMIGRMAVDAQEAERIKGNRETLRQSVEERRQSVSGVSLDEEMGNMIQFQHAYNASARMITAIDEMLDRIINQMGLVGR
ncbi:flagellar hook-associated protein FlgK [Thermolongibacillus altinsuensis]|uniref:flagellar hook-associated protein FlgK n=1 Tax=Thermolongibacillus altinsuensis TaxID=575256 RepID=UPI00242A2BFD|nr:flagellar hook-associated protein FlgK [Thermolongibacillus altinsuensis]GMB09135.1 flagellar hook-associated protein 1 [Thermolongibacillus altinsuensis]